MHQKKYELDGARKAGKSTIDPVNPRCSTVIVSVLFLSKNSSFVSPTRTCGPPTSRASLDSVSPLVKDHC